jgi:hypothetical protein
MTCGRMVELHRGVEEGGGGDVNGVLDGWYADADGLGSLVLLSASLA